MITRLTLMALLAITALFHVSCTDEQLARAAQLSAEADARYAASVQALEAAKQAVAAARELAEKLESEQAQRIVGQAEEALSVATQATDVAKGMADSMRAGVAAAKAAQEAGGSTVGVVTAAATGAVPGILAALALIVKLIESTRRFRQTVKGLDNVRRKIGESEWKAKVAPELEKAQDESVRLSVKAIQLGTKLAAGLMLSLLLAGGAEAAVTTTTVDLRTTVATPTKNTVAGTSTCDADEDILVIQASPSKPRTVVLVNDAAWIYRSSASGTDLKVAAGQTLTIEVETTTTIYHTRQSADGAVKVFVVR